MHTKVIPFLKHLVISYAVSMALVSLAAVLLWKLSLTAGQMQPGIYAIYGLSCLIGGFLTGRRMKARRILWGLLFGLLYFAVLFLLMVLLTHTAPVFLVRQAISLAICLLGGFLGALIS